MKTKIQILKELSTRQSKEKGSLLTGINLSLFIFLGVIIFAVSCRNQGKTKLAAEESFGKIIYETSITNPDTTDSWANECLSGFDRKSLINKLFDDVYNEKIIPYDYFSDKKISPEEIRKMEIEGVFVRKEISRIRFEEKWIWDNEKMEMQKQLISMTLSYQVYDTEGKPRAQKPIFKLKFR